MSPRSRPLRDVFAAAVRRERERLRWSQDKLAGEALIDLRTLQRIEAGEHAASLDTVEKIARALKVSAAELFG